MINCNDIRYQVNGNLILDCVSWRVEPGKINTILGANGAGKSSLFKVALGIISPQDGKIIFDKKPLNKWQGEALAKRRAYMSQANIIPFSIPVYEYLSLARLHFIESTKETNKAVETVIELLDLIALAKKNINQLSGGEWQRVDLARTWCQLLNEEQFSNTVLMLDEPASALDIHQTQHLYQCLAHYVSLGGTVVAIEHDINTAARYSDDLLLLKNGRVLVQGPVNETFTSDYINTCFDVKGEVTFNNKHNTLSFFI
ncbi:ATP-binding cassette domain-containing protein [Alteromonas sp. 5E99-2]|uniref:ATP-binding cassette domain-containing protein n=1 Tax=Alteromonas sp. 5E99-2 TaxID=2817683 RepID=UPI001A991585|nr:ATP-binding cassette domain-containing protein [Alteromonas sp. 5E99-2]MBO1255369.1 ATP-binding cassette domain-containing protein [Alteromonas sp. 5E99-2]